MGILKETLEEQNPTIEDTLQSIDSTLKRIEQILSSQAITMRFKSSEDYYKEHGIIHTCC